MRLVPLQLPASLVRLGITCQGRHVWRVVAIVLHAQQQDAPLAMQCRRSLQDCVTCVLMQQRVELLDVRLVKLSAILYRVWLLPQGITSTMANPSRAYPHTLTHYPAHRQTHYNVWTITTQYWPIAIISSRINALRIPNPVRSWKAQTDNAHNATSNHLICTTNCRVMNALNAIR